MRGPAMRGRLKRSLRIGGLAFVAYGTWAAYANWHHGTQAAVLAAVLQGTLSLLVTTFMTLAMETVFQRTGRGVPGLALTALGPLAAVLALMAGLHGLARTPEILRTITPSALFGSAYCLLYTAGLHRRHRRDRQHG